VLAECIFYNLRGYYVIVTNDKNFYHCTGFCHGSQALPATIYSGYGDTAAFGAILSRHVILVPLVAIAMVLVFDLPRGTKIGLLFLSISAGAPLLPRKLIKLGGDPAFAFSIVIATSLAAIVTVPASLALLQPLLPADTEVDVMRLAMTILKTFLLPLGAGMLFRKFSPDWAEKLGDPIMRYAGIVLLIGAAIIIVSSFGKIMETGLPSILAFAGLTLMALATGHWLGGPDEAQRTSLAVSCATRHIGLAMVLAADIKGPGTFALIATYLFAQHL